MSFEMMLVQSPGVEKTTAQEGKVKSKEAGTEGAFQALMSLALTAFFGGGPESQVVAGSGAASGEAAGEKTAGEKAAQVALAGADTEVLWPQQGGVAEAPYGGQETQVVVESPPGGRTKVAGPVEVAMGATETGGHGEPATQDLIQTTSSNALVVAQRAAFARLDSELVEPDPALHPALRKVHTEAEQAAAFTVSIEETAEVAVAPGYQFQSYGGRDSASPADKATSPVRAREADTDSTLSPGDRPAVVARPVAAIPENSTTVSQLTNATVKSVVARPSQGTAEGESFANVQDEDDEPMAVRELDKPQAAGTGFTVNEITVEAKAGAAHAVAEQPVVAEVSADSEAQEVRSLRDVRAISQTLLEESLKRLPRSVELRLDPPQMGSVTALLSQRGQDVTVKFVAHNGEAQRMLRGATDDLARALGEKGLVLTGFSVDPGYRGDKGQEQREAAYRPAKGRYSRAARLAVVGAGQMVGQVAGSFNWLA